MLTPGLQLGTGLQPTNPIPTDSWAGPYSSIAQANASVPSAVRFEGREVIIWDGIRAKIYGWYVGIADGDLEESASGGGSATASNGLNKVGDDIRLGGPLASDTNIQVDDPYIFSLSTAGYEKIFVQTMFSNTGGPNTGPNYPGAGYAIAEDGLDNIYSGGSVLWQYNKNTQVSRDFTNGWDGTGPACPTGTVYQMAYNSSNSKLYVIVYGGGFGGGLWIYDTVAHSSVLYTTAGGGYSGAPLPTDNLYSVAVNNTNVYVGGESSDVWIMNVNTLVATTVTIVGATQVTNMAMDATYLFASTDIGVWRYNLSTTATNMYDTTGGINIGANLPDNFAYPMVLTGTTLFVGTGLGIWKYNYATDASEVYDSTSGSQTGPNLPVDSVSILTIDTGENEIYVDGGGGVWVLNTVTNVSRLVVLTDYGFATGQLTGFILRDSDNNLWVQAGTELGIVENIIVPTKVNFDKTGMHYDITVDYDHLAENAFMPIDYARTRLYTFGNGLVATVDPNDNQPTSVRIGGSLSSNVTLNTGAIFGFNINNPLTGANGFLSAGGSTAQIGRGGPSAQTRMIFTSTGMVLSINDEASNLLITDNRTVGDQRGLQYSADYSADFTVRSLVDKEYVDNAVAGGTFWPLAGSATLIGDVTIDGDDSNFYSIYISNLTNFGVEASNSASSSSISFQSSSDVTTSIQLLNSNGTTSRSVNLYSFLNTTTVVPGWRMQIDDEFNAGVSVVTTLWHTVSSTSPTNTAGIGAKLEFAVTTGATNDSTSGAGITYALTEGLLADTIGKFIFEINAGGVSGYNTGTAIMEIDQYGARYIADYSANYTARSLVDRDWVLSQISGSIPPPQNNNKDMTPTVTSGDESSTGLTITSTPTGLLIVIVDGVAFRVGDGVKTKDCYFSGDGGTTARTLATIVAGDELIWNGVIAGADLAVTNKIDFYYI